jgi:hypothetical protein
MALDLETAFGLVSVWRGAPPDVSQMQAEHRSSKREQRKRICT